MNESRKTLVIVLVAVAAVIALWSAWKFLMPSAPSESERTTTKAGGSISPMSSMLGPDASGKPRTQVSDQDKNSTSHPVQGARMNRMMGPGGGGPPGAR